MYLVIKSIIQANLVALNLYILYFHKNKTNEIDYITFQAFKYQILFELIEIAYMFFIRKKVSKSSLSHHTLAILLCGLISKFGKKDHANIFNFTLLNQSTGILGFNLYYLLKNTKYETFQTISVFLQCLFIRMPIALISLYRWNTLTNTHSAVKILGNILGIYQTYNEGIWLNWAMRKYLFLKLA